MPYKDPERKRQWEREHRVQRNVRRRMQPSDARTKPGLSNPAPDPGSNQQAQSAWKIMAGFALAVGIGLLGVARPLVAATVITPDGGRETEPRERLDSVEPV